MSQHDEERAMERLYDRTAPSGKPMSEFDAMFWFEVKSPNATTRSIALSRQRTTVLGSTPKSSDSACMLIPSGAMRRRFRWTAIAVAERA